MKRKTVILMTLVALTLLLSATGGASARVAAISGTLTGGWDDTCTTNDVGTEACAGGDGGPAGDGGDGGDGHGGDGGGGCAISVSVGGSGNCSGGDAGDGTSGDVGDGGSGQLGWDGG